MRRILLIVAILLLATPAFAVVTVTATREGNDVNGNDTIRISYNCNGTPVEKVRAFGLDINVMSAATRTIDVNRDGNTIPNVRDFNVGDNNGFGIFPGNYRERGLSPTDPNWRTAQYTPVAPGADPDKLPGFGSNGITAELGTLFVGDGNRPPSAGTLFRFDVNCHGVFVPATTVHLSKNTSRGIVLEDGSSVADANLVFVDCCACPNPACEVPIPASITYPCSNNINGKYTVSWASSAGATYYVLERSTDAGLNWTQLSSGADTSYNADEPNLTSNTYRVKACNAICCSDYKVGSCACVVTYCYGPSDPQFANWGTMGKPRCWCYPHQCQGDADGLQEGKPLVYVGTNDLTILTSAWLATPAQITAAPEPNACADFDRTTEGKPVVEIGTNDLTILTNNWLQNPAGTCSPGNRTP